MPRLRTWLLAGAMGLLSYGPTHSRAADGFAEDLEIFAKEMAAKHDFAESDLQALLSVAKFRQDVIDAITRPAEAKPWHEYRKIFLTAERIRGGVAFWEQHAADLDRASAEFGVPAEIVVAIIGVETRYGKFTGKYRVLDALATLAFGYPKRASFFRAELEQLLLLTAEEKHLDPTRITGSYAGAMGIPQFISSSYRRYAIDFDGDRKRDLLGSASDAIGSVANYLALHGWTRDGPIAVRAISVGEAGSLFLDAPAKPSLRWDRLREAGVEGEQAITDLLPIAPLRLELPDGYEHWLGFDNFYAITRYNRSNLYAMAVLQLSRAIADERGLRLALR